MPNKSVARINGGHSFPLGTFKLAVVLVLALTASGCATMSETSYGAVAKALAQSQPGQRPAWAQIASEGIDALKSGQTKQASQKFNLALKLNVSNSYLQTLNSLAYHIQGEQGANDLMDLAIEGYALAIRFDPSNWYARFLRGRALLDAQRYADASADLLLATAIRPGQAEVLAALVEAAYYARDFRSARIALAGLRASLPQAEWSSQQLISCAVVYAAIGEQQRSDHCAGLMKAKGNLSAFRLQHVEDLIRDWARARAAAVPGDAGTKAVTGESTKNPVSVDLAERMVVVDVVLIGSQEDMRERYGINLLDGLSLQFGDTQNALNGWQSARSVTTDHVTPTSSTNTTTRVRYLTIPAITYSLNIANALDSVNEVLAKPSLIALSGQTAEFFSGVAISAAAISTGVGVSGNSVSIEKEVGVRLAVTPTFLEGDRIKLGVVAERTFLTDPSKSVIFQFRMDTTKTIINSTVVMKLGETLILGGLSESENTDELNGVPGLRRIPVMGSLFSTDSKRLYRKTITILLTPQLADRNLRDMGGKDPEAPSEENRVTQGELERAYKLGSANEAHMYRGVQAARGGRLGKVPGAGDIPRGFRAQTVLERYGQELLELAGG